MSASNLHDFQRCRLCALPISSNSLIPYANTIYEPMIDKLRSFELHIKKDDGLPECICHGCTGILATFIETMELFLEADKKLKKLLESSKQTTIEKHINDTKNPIEFKEDNRKERLKRNSEEKDIEIVERKRAKRRGHLNLLRKAQTPILNHPKNVDDKETEEKSPQAVNKKSDVIEENELKEIKNTDESEKRKKQERKQTLGTENSKKVSGDIEVVNVTGKHDHDYSMDTNFNLTSKTITTKNSNIKTEIDISQESDTETQINKTSPQLVNCGN